MAEEAPRHSAASAQHSDGAAPSDAAGSADPVRLSEPAASPFGLPLRRSFRPAAAETKIYDITEKFTKASSALEVGQLVKDEYFTLFESIGAIEIMDPKMDSGFLQPGETLEDTYDTLNPILPEELIGIMDQLLCHEMSWHTGYPLSQNLFTSLYIDKLLWPEPKTLEQAQFYRGDITDERRPGPLLEVLRAYCLALIKGCDFVIAKVTGRDFFEEEDFCTHTYNRVLFVRIPMDVFLRELDAAVEWMEDPDLKIDESLRVAIITRLEFRKNFLLALDLECQMDRLDAYWPPVLEGLASINTTHQLGKPVPSAFSTKMQRRLASTVPPRPIVELDFKDASEKLKQLCVDCEEATRFVLLPPDPLEYQSFLWAYASRSPAPLPYSRSYLATLLFHPDILTGSVSLPLTDLKTLVFPSSPVVDPSNWAFSPPRNPLLPKPPRLQLAMLIDEFIDRSGQPYLDLWVALGQNRCRLRRMLTHVIVGWDLLQLDAGLVDQDIMRAIEELGGNMAEQTLEHPLTTWVYHRKLWMIEKVVLLSFEQDIYLPDEYAGMYYFLSKISTTRIGLLRKIELHYNDRIRQLVRSMQLPEAQMVDRSAPYISSLLDEARGICELSKALHSFYTISLYLGLLPCPNRPFGSEPLRYELRMKTFLGLQPPEVPPFPEFQAALQPYGPYNAPTQQFYTDLHNEQSELWKSVDAPIKAAKEFFSALKKQGAQTAKAGSVEVPWNKEVQSALASCVALGVSTASLRTVAKEFDGKEGQSLGVKVELPEIQTGKRYSEGWVVGKVVKL
ncbi:Mak10-domain-containing protein [Corynespora cassiicola Philippines]|uniref:Mak10-domain-containing protein n=1 Tax=Corynespora cassiicola Philippines TaxID=1448308 RepID=A0A2T2NS05_CORCC|nr:Mak10-domain-containing protein [Corynespora cassiicola Philippines]